MIEFLTGIAITLSAISFGSLFVVYRAFKDVKSSNTKLLCVLEASEAKTANAHGTLANQVKEIETKVTALQAQKAWGPRG